MPAAAAGKLSQGELAEAALFEYAGAAPHPLVDIGANLADPAFDQVRLSCPLCVTHYVHSGKLRIFACACVHACRQAPGTIQ